MTREEKIKQKEAKEQHREEMAKFFPPYTRGEEIFNAVTHIVGGALGIVALVVGVIYAAIYQKTSAAVISMVFFGLSIMLLYTMSSIYHFLYPNRVKKIFRIFDHCTIYLLIAGTYTPVCFVILADHSPWNYVLFAGIQFLALIGVVFNAIMLDKKPVKVLSQILYLVMGWTIAFFLPWISEAISLPGTIMIFAGGLAYTVGVIFYALGKKVRYFHAIWHLFDLAGTILQFLGILLYGIIL